MSVTDPPSPGGTAAPLPSLPPQSKPAEASGRHRTSKSAENEAGAAKLEAVEIETLLRDSGSQRKLGGNNKVGFGAYLPRICPELTRRFWTSNEEVQKSQFNPFFNDV